MEGLISSGLFETVDGGVHCLASGGERARSQHFDLLGVSDGGSGVDDLLSSFLQLSGEMSELGYLAFDKRVPQLLYCAIDDGLVRVSCFEHTLLKGVEGGLSAVAGSGT